MGESGRSGRSRRAWGALSAIAAVSLSPRPAWASGGYEDLAWAAFTLVLAVGCGLSLVVITLASIVLARRGRGAGFARFARLASPALGALPLLSSLKALYHARPVTPSLVAACSLLVVVMGGLVAASLAAARRLARSPGRDRPGSGGDEGS